MFHAVLVGETGNRTLTMFIDTAGQIGCVTDIQGAKLLACENEERACTRLERGEGIDFLRGYFFTVFFSAPFSSVTGRMTSDSNA
jgi:hypothetical protein